LIDVDDLRERNAEDVVALLGKPQGKIQTKAGVLWLYAHWRVQFDTQNRVLGVEKDFPIPLAAFDAKLAGSTPSPDPRAPRPTGTAPAAPPSINVVSNNGQPVDLLPLMPDGKVTVVDFYADWCGACRQTGPYLERLAAQDPQVALVKVNIGDWQTPVTRQFDIRSVPNIRVFDRRKAQVGSPTHDLRLVFEYISQAKR
jgi:thiol-disulfide isomerase/thioredoxin